jgi:hypothetical protein
MPVLRHFREGLGAMVRSNSTAYGYSLAAGGAVSIIAIGDRTAHAVDVFVFAAGGSVTFTLMNIVATKGFRIQAKQEPPVVIAYGTSVGFISVLLSIGSAWGSAALFHGWLGWLVGGFVFSIVYLVASGFELVLGHALRQLTGVEHLEER